jgi:hypothetical protein
MKKTILLIAFLSITLLSNAQIGKLENNWYSTFDAEFIFAYKYRYSYHIEDSYVTIIDENSLSGFLLNSFGAQYTYNYTFFSKLSIGALAAVQSLSKPSTIFMIKAGGILKFFFVNRDNVYIYTQLAHVFSLDKSQFTKGGNGRLGLGMPIYRTSKLNVNINIFAEHTSLKLDDADPIYGIEDEVPLSLTIRSFGISFGIQF